MFKAAETSPTSFIIPSEWRNATLDGLASQRNAGVYTGNGAVFQCVSKHILAYPEARMRVYRDSDNPIPDHDAQALLDRPSDQMSLGQMKDLISYYRIIGGNAYLRKVRSKGGRLVQLDLYSDAQVSVEGRGAIAERYVYWTGEVIPREDIIHLRWPAVDPVAPYKGLSPLMALAREYGIDNEISRLVHSVLVNDAVIKGVFTVGDQIAPNAVANLKEDIKSYSGENRGRTPVLPRGMDYKRMALGLQELDLSGLRNVPEARIAGALLMSVIHAGLTAGMDASTYDNRTGARLEFYEDTMMKMWVRDANELSAGLVNEFPGEPFYVWPDTSSVLALRQNEDQVHARARDDYEKGLITLNESRAIIGLPAVSDGDRFRVEIEMPPPAPIAKGRERIVLKSAETGDVNAPEEMKDRDPEELAYFKSYDDRASDATSRLAGTIATSFDALLSEIEGGLKSSPSALLKAGTELFDVESWQKRFADVAEPDVADYITKTMEAAVTEVGTNWQEVRSSFDDAISRVTSKSTSKIAEALPTVKAELRELLDRNSDKTATEVKDLIRTRFKDIYSESRAALIARTTTTVATGASQKEAWKELDIPYVWLTGTNPRDTHASANGKSPDDEGMFSIGTDRMETPGTGAQAKENANCNCMLRARPRG